MKNNIFFIALSLYCLFSRAQYTSLFQTLNLKLSYPLYFIKDSEESRMKDKWELHNRFNNIRFGVG